MYAKQVFRVQDARTEKLHTHIPLIPAMEGWWRALEPLWRLILTLFYYSPSLASELSRISTGLRSLSWQNASPRHSEPVYSAASRSTGVYNCHAHIRAIKNKSKPAWCKPFVKLVFTGTFLESKNIFFPPLLFVRTAALAKPALVTFWQMSEKHFHLSHTALLFFYSAWIFTSSPTIIQYGPLSEYSFVLA